MRTKAVDWMAEIEASTTLPLSVGTWWMNRRTVGEAPRSVVESTGAQRQGASLTAKAAS